jgi:hypothetical protein
MHAGSTSLRLVCWSLSNLPHGVDAQLVATLPSSLVSLAHQWNEARVPAEHTHTRKICCPELFNQRQGIHLAATSWLEDVRGDVIVPVTYTMHVSSD